MSNRVSAQSASGGAPRWTYVIGAIVGAGGLVWTIASYFIAHSGIPEPVSPKDSFTTSITVSGSGVGIGQMNGGQIIIGPPPPSGLSGIVKPKQ